MRKLKTDAWMKRSLKKGRIGAGLEHFKNLFKR